MVSRRPLEVTDNDGQGFLAFKKLEEGRRKIINFIQMFMFKI